MGETSIEWTRGDDGTPGKTWNPVRGCTKVSPGCKHCYAETFAERFRGVPGHSFEQGFDLRLVPEKLADPLRWRKPCRVFVNSMSDLFHEDVPDEYIAAVFGVMAACPQHTFQVLTKRAERLPRWFEWARRQADVTHGHIAPEQRLHWFLLWQARLLCMVEDHADAGWPLPNVWLGVSAENQETADERIPHLLVTPAAVRFVSAEPLLGPIGLARLFPSTRGMRNDRFWVIVGGESGPGARPCALEWIESIVGQCRTASVPVFVKQLGAHVVSEHRTAPIELMPNPSKLRTWNYAPNGETWAWRMALTDAKGGDIDQFPEDLRVREFPEARL